MRQYLFLATVATFVAGGPLLADTVRTTTGTPQSGTIVGTTADVIKLSKGGTVVEIPTNEVVEVALDDETFPVKSARKMVEDGQYADAIEKLKGEQGKGELVKQEIAFLRAYAMGKLALAGSADKAAASKALLDFASQASGSYHFYEVARMLGDLAVSSGNYDGATKYYGALSKAPWPDMKMSGNVLEARALLAQDKADAAIKKFDQVLKTDASVAGAARQKSFASVGKAQALALTGKADEGIALAQKVIENADPQDKELFGRAYNALGQCYMKQSQPKEALLAYLHTDILFYRDPEIHAEALYHLSNLWKEVNSPDEATSARNLLINQYPGSVWTNRQ